MLKNILNLEGAQQLTNNEQKSINGGVTPGRCSGDEQCWPNHDPSCQDGLTGYCYKGYCVIDLC